MAVNFFTTLTRYREDGFWHSTANKKLDVKYWIKT
jgi:hypothetical protein